LEEETNQRTWNLAYSQDDSATLKWRIGHGWLLSGEGSWMRSNVRHGLAWSGKRIYASPSPNTVH
jgi:hypothetical protein